MSGRFITFEGGEAGGKTTQARRLFAALRAAGRTAVLTREPGGAPGAERLRAMLLAPDAAWGRTAEVLLHFAARAEHVATTIAPALDAGEWVVSDRFADSTMAYQGWGQGADRDMIAYLTAAMRVRPDLTFVLDLPVEASVRRLSQRGSGADRYERLGAAFFTRVREGFLAIARDEPDRCVVVDADRDEEAVAAEILAAVREWL
ncbi:MAG: dTMP kinase [Acidisphaera sp.]|nr:dTMP kinase [Acidisphaera sp.]MBV9813904.1 dTMP kinase [Acetobacteraceae bacterium]